MKEEIINQVSELKGRRTTMEVVNVEFGDKKYKREIVHRPNAAVAIVKTRNGRFIFIKQFRTAIQKEIIEAVAGCVEEGETARNCIIREVEEETGHKVIEIEELTSFYASPGYSDEIIHAFYAKVEDVAGKQNPDDDERVNVVYTNDTLEADYLLHDGIADGKTLIAWELYYASDV